MSISKLVLLIVAWIIAASAQGQTVPDLSQMQKELESMKQAVADVQSELRSRPRRGSSFLPNRALAADEHGHLSAIAGDPNSCVRVDGTAGPCGVMTASVFVDGEGPIGPVNGSNRVFVLTRTPLSNSLQLFHNGLILREEVDYRLAARTITLLGTPPSDTDSLVAYYRVGDSKERLVDAEVPGVVATDNGTELTLRYVPVPAASVRLYHNGLLLQAGVDYDCVGRTIRLLSSRQSSGDDSFVVSYRVTDTSDLPAPQQLSPEILRGLLVSLDRLGDDLGGAHEEDGTVHEDSRSWAASEVPRRPSQKRKLSSSDGRTSPAIIEKRLRRAGDVLGLERE